MFRNMLTVAITFIAITTFSQENAHLSLSLDPALKKNANAVIRLNDIEITIEAQDKMNTKVKRIITVLNKQGNSKVNAYLHYDNTVKIKTLEALVYNAFGKEIKKIKKNSFNDVSAVDGGTLYSDSRLKYLEYTPVNYPYTIELNYETTSTSTAFLRPFAPLEGYYVSTENSTYKIISPSNIEIRKKEKNLNGYHLKKEGELHYTAKNLHAIKKETHSPLFVNFSPQVLFSASQFSLEGVSAAAATWTDFGKWMYNDLIKDAYDLSPETINTVKNLVAEENDPIEKAKKIYQYVQDKTRYISVQVGIGGWKPFNASEVDKLGYGDCKGLTNYTMALLKAVDVEANYSVVFSGSSQRDIEHDFASMQGNHVILSIPTNDDQTIWLECTSQKLPFGFIGDFTDNRDVLVVTPEGGIIKRTKKYETNENAQITKGQYTITEDGSISASMLVNSTGIQYDNKYYLETMDKTELQRHYKEHWSYVNNINMIKTDLKNNKTDIEFTEHIDFSASNYATVVGDRMLITLNATNRNTYTPNRYRHRKLPLKINRGFKDIDNIDITLPKGYKIEAMFQNKTIKTIFGEYKISLEQKDASTLSYKREFSINDGEFSKDDYQAFRDFYKEVAKHDNSKIALIKNN